MTDSDRNGFKEIRIYGACVTGVSHIRDKEGCEDAWKAELVTDLGSKRAVIAISDGLGSANDAKQGSQIAVTAAIAFLTKNPGKVFEAVCFARQELVLCAEDLVLALRDLACTLVVAELTQESISLAHIGDGVVIGQESKSGTLLLLSGPGPSEYINEVIPLTAENSIDHIRCREESGINIFVMATDGCQGALFTRKDGEICPFEPFLRPLFTYFTPDITEDIGSAALNGLLSSEKMKMISDDDKTMVLVTRL